MRQPSFGASFLYVAGQLSPRDSTRTSRRRPPRGGLAIRFGDRQLGLGLPQVEPSSSSTPWLPDREGIFHRRVPDVPLGGSYFCPEGACAFESFGVFCLLAS